MEILMSQAFRQSLKCTCICKSITYVCMCSDAQCTRFLWFGCRSCMARVTSFSAMPVGMWGLWLRPAHKTLYPGTVLLPLQTGKQRPMGKPHRQPASGASLYDCLFQSHTCRNSADPGVRIFSFWLLWYSVSVTSFTSPEHRRITLLWKLLLLMSVDSTIIINVISRFYACAV